jgi:hypothetical protein
LLDTRRRADWSQPKRNRFDEVESLGPLERRVYGDLATNAQLSPLPKACDVALKRSESVVGFGDFQTPDSLAKKALEFVRSRGVSPGRILEPTCGSGTFVSASYSTWDSVSEVVGIEINPVYDGQLTDLSKRYPSFRYDYLDAQMMESEDLKWKSSESLLICGNLPWVTTDALSRLVDDYQLRIRDNPKKLKGLDALTGSGSFDISERLALRFVQIAVKEEKADIALLLKESVARRILVESRRLYASAAVIKIDSLRWFGVKVQSCLLYMHFEKGLINDSGSVEYFKDFSSERTEQWTLDGGVVRRALPNMSAKFRLTPGLVWRHGIKHDAAAVFEFGSGEGPSVSADLLSRAGLSDKSCYVYPFVTARDLHRSLQLERVQRSMLVPQRKLGDRSIESDPTAVLEREYLLSVNNRLAMRRSSIYRNKPFYALFGVGTYTFSPFKAAVAGLYIRPHFRFLGPIAGKPIVLGDTSYFVPCENAIDAAIIVTLANEDVIMAEVQGMAFAGKRPVTKRVLDALDFHGAFILTERESLVARVIEHISSWGGEKLVVPSRQEVVERAASLFGSLIA